MVLVLTIAAPGCGDGGPAGRACTMTSECTAGEVCDPASGTCRIADAGSTSDAGPSDASMIADAGPGDFDAGPVDVDGGPGEGDGGPADVDAGPGDVDGGPGEVDSGPVDVDGGPAPVDAGPGDAGDLPPTCTITAPLDGAAQDYDDDFTFVAMASDPEDGPLSGASVVWRSSLEVAPLGSGLTITTLLDPGVHTITCTATDSAANTGTDSIVVTSRSPVAVINHPGDGETRPSSMLIPFVGVGRDFDDGTLTGASLVWTSSIDGMIGTGNSFSRALSPGTNVVTLTVTDSDGNSGTDTVTLTITP